MCVCGRAWIKRRRHAPAVASLTQAQAGRPVASWQAAKQLAWAAVSEPPIQAAYRRTRPQPTQCQARPRLCACMVLAAWPGPQQMISSGPSRQP